MALKTAEEVDASLLTVSGEVVGAALARPDRPNLDRGSNREGHLDQIEETLAGWAGFQDQQGSRGVVCPPA